MSDAFSRNPLPWPHPLCLAVPSPHSSTVQVPSEPAKLKGLRLKAGVIWCLLCYRGWSLFLRDEPKDLGANGGMPPFEQDNQQASGTWQAFLGIKGICKVAPKVPPRLRLLSPHASLDLGMQLGWHGERCLCSQEVFSLAC